MFALTNKHTDAGFAIAGIVAGQVAQVVAEIKSVDSLVTGYVDDLTRDFQDVLSGDLLIGEARRRHRAYIKRDAEPAFIEGLAEGGVDEPDLTDEDKAVITDWITEQRGFVDGLWDAVEKLADDYERALIDKETYNTRRRGLYERIGLWGGTLRELAGQGKASALANMMVTWRMGETEKHCKVCNRLDGKRARLKWFTSRGYIPQENNSTTLECGGWRCQCTLQDSKGGIILPA